MKTFAELYESMKDTLEYQIEELSLVFTESVLLRMEELDDMSGKSLAERMEVSEAYVSKLLKGKTNFTLETLVKLARALDCRIEAPQLLPNSKQAPSQSVLFERRPQLENFRPRAVSTRLVVTQDYDDDTNPAAAA